MFIIYSANVFVSNFHIITDAPMVMFLPKYLYMAIESNNSEWTYYIKEHVNVEDFITNWPHGSDLESDLLERLRT